jgi:hypothetical protein
MLRIIFAAILATIAGRQCFALDMNWATDEHEKLAYLNLWGTIQEGDDQKFLRNRDASPPEGLSYFPNQCVFQRRQRCRCYRDRQANQDTSDPNHFAVQIRRHN